MRRSHSDEKASASTLQRSGFLFLRKGKQSYPDMISKTRLATLPRIIHQDPLPVLMNIGGIFQETRPITSKHMKVTGSLYRVF